jgi:hypothetical protein
MPNPDHDDFMRTHFGVDPGQFRNPAPAADDAAGTGGPVAKDPAVAAAPVGTAPAPQPDPEAVVRKWLDDHQFAPPEQQQPEGKEPHVLLDAREMTLSEAEKLAADGARQPQDVVHRVLAASLNSPQPKDWSFNPVVGPGNDIPGIHLNSTDPALQRELSKANELQTLDDWLMRHGFEAPNDSDPAARKALFDGQDTTIDVVADKAMSMLGNTDSLGGVRMSYLTKDEVIAHLRQKYVRSRVRKDNSHLPQVQVQYMGVPKGLQAAPGDKTDQNQFTFQVNFQHGDSNNKAGFDLTAPIATVVFDDQGNILQAQAGGQAAWVKPLFKGWLQAAGFGQATVTIDFTKNISGHTVLGAAGFQAVAGGQIALAPVLADESKFAFLSGHVQFGIQVQGGVQDKFAGPQKGAAGVAAAGGFITISF